MEQFEKKWSFNRFNQYTFDMPDITAAARPEA